jgi:hypothetical protein
VCTEVELETIQSDCCRKTLVVLQLQKKHEDLEGKNFPKVVAFADRCVLFRVNTTKELKQLFEAQESRQSRLAAQIEIFIRKPNSNIENN